MKIFVTYSWINDRPDENVLLLVSELRKNGYNAVCDVILSQQETSIHFPKMMAKNLKEADKVIIVLSEKYREKADLFKGGVGVEFQYIIEDITTNSLKYILATFENNYTNVIPDFLRGREIINLNVNNIISDHLLHKINNTNEYNFPNVNPIKNIPKSKNIDNTNNYNEIELAIYKQSLSEYELFKLEFHTKEMSKEEYSKINEIIYGPYIPITSMYKFRDLRIEYYLLPLIKEKIEIELKIRKKYHCKFSEKRILCLKIEIKNIIEEEWNNIAGIAYYYAVHNVIENIGDLPDYKDRELNEEKSEMCKTIPDGLMSIVDALLEKAYADSILSC